MYKELIGQKETISELSKALQEVEREKYDLQ